MLLKSAHDSQKYYMVDQAYKSFTSAMMTLNIQLAMPVIQREKCYSRTIDVIRPLNLLENCTIGTEFHERAQDLLMVFNRIKNGFDIPSSYTAPDYAFVNKLLEQRLEKAQKSGIKTDKSEEL